MNLKRSLAGMALFAALALTIAGFTWGAAGALTVALLAIMETSESFDNAVMNAKILRKLSAKWQKRFMTWGFAFAVGGMRLVFPVLIVAITAHMSPVHAVMLALHEQDRYQHLVTAAQPAINGFGGTFLLMIFLDFLLTSRDLAWLTAIERPIAKLGKIESLSVVITLAALLATSGTLAHHSANGGHDVSGTVLISGIAGLITYLIVKGVSDYFESRVNTDGDDGDNGKPSKSTGGVGLVGGAALAMFMYLETVDASFSFDGVISAFAITHQIFMIAMGLGVGALVVRFLTVYMVQLGTIDEYEYLEHGAHYAIGALAVILGVGIRYEVPELITGLVGALFIGAAFVSSLVRNRRRRANGGGHSAQGAPETGAGSATVTG
ncbi:hypothetical protein BIV57_17755 [Mangrovactinospora gilvigrisea]|uniref:DUF475 domain-containing protein n=2 Tax=Mangrovactinospora gilvigrisea TaxID=1428644 RepID=A0A1J7C3M7_9ACTN|nr:hypothetical protein BIV57_17755 [Mangrovactinospora gilvigrisea]